MKKQHISNLTKLISLGLLAAPVSTWANDCQEANRIYNRSLKVAPAQQSGLLTQAFRLCPNHLHTLVQLANIREKEGQLSDAQWLYREAIKVNPHFAPAYAGLGDVLIKRKDYQGAEAAFQKFLTMQEKSGDPEFQPHIQHYTERLEEAQKKHFVPSTEIFAALTPKKSFGPPKIEVQIKFSTNSAKVTKHMWRQCKKMAKAIKGVFNTPGLQNSRIRIDGHTDSRGRTGYNKYLSRIRAEKVKYVLVKNFKLPADRLEIVGWGEEKPIATNRTAQGRKNNRRVTLIRMDK